MRFWGRAVPALTLALWADILIGTGEALGRLARRVAR